MSYKEVILASANEIFHRLRGKDSQTDITQDSMYKALCDMIRWTQQFKRDPQAPQLAGVLSDLAWAKEFSTVKFCLPRMSGHTHFIKQLLDLGRHYGAGMDAVFNKAVVMFPTPEMALANDFSPGWSWVGVANKSMDKFRGYAPDAVIVDAAAVLSKKETDKIYRTFSRFASNPDFVFVFLG